MARFAELIVVIVAMLIPQFLLAREVDGDEFAKSMVGVALAGVILSAYKAWQHKSGGSNGDT